MSWKAGIVEILKNSGNFLLDATETNNASLKVSSAGAAGGVVCGGFVGFISHALTLGAFGKLLPTLALTGGVGAATGVAVGLAAYWGLREAGRGFLKVGDLVSGSGIKERLDMARESNIDTPSYIKSFSS